MSKNLAKKPNTKIPPTQDAVGVKTTRSKGLPEYKPSESQIAQTFVYYIHITHPHLAKLLVKLDNEGKTSWAHGKQKKAEGKLKGASDYFLAWPVKKRVTNEDGSWTEFLKCGMWHELKTHKGKESPEQLAFGENMIKAGYAYYCSHSVDEAIKNLEEYLATE